MAALAGGVVALAFLAEYAAERFGISLESWAGRLDQMSEGMMIVLFVVAAAVLTGVTTIL